MVKKGFLKKTGCILISASIILAGWTFMGSSVSEAELDTDFVLEEPVENPDQDDSDTITEDLTEDVEEGTTDDSPQTIQEDPVPTDGEVVDDENGDVDISSSQVATRRLMSISPEILTASLTATGSNTEAEYDGATLKKVPAGVGSTFTVRSGTTTIAANAFSDSNVSEITFASGSQITSIGDQGGWPYAGTVVWCPGCTADSYVVSWFLNLHREISVQFGEGPDPTNLYTITIVYNLLTKDGASAGTYTYTDDRDMQFELDEGDVPAWDAPSTKVMNGLNYELQSGPSPSFVAATADATYTYTYKATSDTPYYTITINYLLQNSSGGTVATVTKETKAVASGVTPTHSAQSTYTYSGTDYTLQSGPSPDFTAATADATYTYTYKAGGSSGTTYSIKFQYILQNTNGYTVTTIPISTTSVAAGTVPSFANPSTYYYSVDGKTYNFVSGPSPALTTATADATYSYYYREGTSGRRQYTITVNDVYYNYDKTAQTEWKTNRTLKRYEGESYSVSPLSDSRYECFYGEKTTGNAYENKEITFKYRALSNTVTSTTTTTVKTTGQTPYASAAAQANQKYKITQGANQSVAKDGGPLTITCNGAANQLLYILLDGMMLDPSNYTIKSGSTILTLTKECVAGLSLGNHVIQFQYNDGYALTGLNVAAAGTKTTTTVTYKVAADGSISAGHTKDSTPKTADGFDSRYLLCIAIFLMGAGAIMMGKQKKLEALLAGRDEE